ncbi:hypothetical protein KIW84_054212 [Lathyrus oleraceus]|uniref:MULE transposase domain-containing protein n=1 Tax=Pisum sativum TaxID=3888 RepID=A0A9D4WXC2_PEA|nr:hypothetical protein KIW84_054212 [Pisum sativum]
MTSTELTFAVAFAYMESEQTENFCWILEKLKELFVKKDLCPQVILTDRDLALMKAIEIVFPRSINLLCRFHINKNICAKCKQHVVNDLQKTIDTLWMEVVWASDEVEYGQRLHQLEQACVDYSGFINYVKGTWLTPHRHRFVGAWINRVLHLGNTTTNRVESAHWKLKQMLGNSIGDMVKCWEAMNNNLRLQLGNIRASFQKSFYEVEHARISPFYGYLRGSVSRAALRRIVEELLRVDYVGTNRQICGCCRNAKNNRRGKYRAATDAIHPMTKRERRTNLRKGKERSYDQRLQGTGVGYTRRRISTPSRPPYSTGSTLKR